MLLLLSLPLISSTALMSADNPLNQTVMIGTPQITNESFGLWRKGSDAFWGDTENLFADVKSGAYNPTHSKYIEKLDKTVGNFAKNNDPRLPELIDLCRTNYRGQIQLRPEKAAAAHACLYSNRKTLQSNLKGAIESNDKKFLEEQNKLIAALKESLAQQITAIKTNLDTHKKSSNDLLNKESGTIRKYKKSELITHKLNTEFTFSKNEDSCDCSTNEKKNPDDVDTFYSDQHILEALGIDEATYATLEKSEKTLKTLLNIQELLKSISPLRY